MKKSIFKATTCALFAIGGGVGTLSATSVLAEQVEGVCAEQSSGKIDVKGSFKTLTLTAPEGQLISGYCVKSGSINDGNGPEYVSVVPPSAEVTISHSTGKDISHYSLLYVSAPTPPPPPPPSETDVCANIDGNQATVPAGMTQDGENCVAPTLTLTQAPTQAPMETDLCPNLDGMQTAVPAGSQISNGQCVPIAASLGPVPGAAAASPSADVASAGPVLAGTVLPATGSTTAPVAGAAAALLLLGFAGLTLSRRRSVV